MPPFATPQPAFNAVIRRVKHMRQRHIEHFIYLARLRNWGEIGSDMSQNGGDLKPGYRFMFGKPTQNLHLVWRKANFFMRLAQSGSFRARIALANLTAGQSNLPWMMLQMRCPLGEDQCCASGPVPQADQHRRGQKTATGWKNEAWVQIKIRRSPPRSTKCCANALNINRHCPAPLQRQRPMIADQIRNARRRIGNRR